MSELFEKSKKPLDAGKLASLKTPPHSIEAEQAVLGGLMLDNSVWDTVVEKLVEEDFFRHEHQLIYRVMFTQTEADKPLDVVTLVEALDSLGELDDAGGIEYLSDLASNARGSANIGAYAEIIAERSKLRKLISVAYEIADSGYNPAGQRADDVLDVAEQKVFKIADDRPKDGGPKAINPLLQDAVTRIDELFQSDGALTGLPTGFKDLDDKTSGLQKSDLIIVAGRPSMGKTSFAMNLAENALLLSDKPVLVFSLEMPAESLVTRMLSSVGKIDQKRLRTGKLEEDDWPRLTAAVSKLKDKPLMIDDSVGLSPMEMRSRARRVAREHGSIGLIVVDYLQLMQIKGFGDNRVGEISEISRSLKTMAREFECPVIALSQLNRSLEQRPNKRPVMSDLRESGAIEQDADIIAFVYRDEVYNEDTQDKGVAEIIIGKQRNGPIGTVKLGFLGQFTRFETLAMQAYDEVTPNTNDFRAWATIDLGALLLNFAKARSYCPSANVVAVVKANAYGHGVLAVAQTLRSQLRPTDCFGVASIEEAMELRGAGIDEPILLLEGVFSAQHLQLALSNGLQLVVHSLFQLEMLIASLAEHAEHGPVTVWLKVDTGMHRLGFDEQEFAQAWQQLAKHPRVAKIVLMSHFACADDTGSDMSERQLSHFKHVLDAAAVPEANREISFAASSGIQLWPQAHYQWLRPGIMLYGGTAAAGENAIDRGIAPVMTLRAKLIAIKTVAAGQSVGYGASYVCPHEQRIGVISIGYGDGYPRRMPQGTPVIVNCKTSKGVLQRRVSLCGRVSMDMITVDLSECLDAQVGDEVILWGEGLPADEIARHCNTIGLRVVLPSDPPSAFCLSLRVIDRI